MTEHELGADLALKLDELRARGCTVMGPGRLSPGQTPPTDETSAPRLPGFHVQIGCGHRMFEGFGGSPDAAVADVLSKMAGFTPSAPVLGGG